MSFILKVFNQADQSPVPSDNEHSLYADITSVHFRRQGDEATAHLWLREPIKTGEVAGFVEVEKYVTFNGTAYVMNENGKTVSSFTGRRSGSRAPASTSDSDDQVKQMVDRFLSWRLPANFNPDNGISYARPNYDPSIDATPAGTNLFDYTQAETMVRHLLGQSA